MKTSRSFNKVMIVLSILVAGILVTSCSKKAGKLASAFDYHTKTESEARLFRISFEERMKADRFTETSSPGGAMAFAGAHSSGEITRWFKGSHENSPPFFVRFTKVKGPSGETHFMADVGWEFFGSHQAIEKMEERVASYSRRLSSEFDERHFSKRSLP